MSQDDDDDLQAQLEEALRRSREETTLEESNLAAAMANSLTTRDEELALAMQREQMRLLEADLYKNPSVDLPAPANGSHSSPRNSRQTSLIPHNRPPHVQQSSRASQPNAPASNRRPRGHSASQQNPNVQMQGRGHALANEQQPRGRRHAPQAGGNNSAVRRSSPPNGYATSTRRNPQNPQVARPRRPSPPSSHGSPRQTSVSSHSSRSGYSASPSTPPTADHFSHPNSPIPPVQLRDPSPRSARQSHSPPSGPSPSYAAAAASSVPQYKPPSLHGGPSRGSPLISNPGTAAPPPIPEGEPVVVIDGQNVACHYGGNKFQSRGVEVALDYYASNGVPAIALLPRNKVDNRRVLAGGVPNTHVADDPALLMKLSEQGRVFFTPAGAHDDYFLLTYAMRKQADIISNDRFMKELDMQETAQDARALRSFLDSHLIPYTFVAGDFVPNPKPSQLGRALHQSRTIRR